MTIQIENINTNLDTCITIINEITSPINKYNILNNLMVAKNNVVDSKYLTASDNIKNILPNQSILIGSPDNINPNNLQSLLDISFTNNSIPDYEELLNINEILIEVKYSLDFYIPPVISSTKSYADIEKTKKLQTLIDEFDAKFKLISGYNSKDYLNNMNSINYYNNKIRLIDNQLRIETDSNIISQLNINRNNYISQRPSPLPKNNFVNSLGSNPYNYNIPTVGQNISYANTNYYNSTYSNYSNLSSSFDKLKDNSTKISNGLNNISNLVSGAKNTVCSGMNLLDVIQKGGGFMNILNSTMGTLANASSLFDSAKQILNDPLGSIKSGGFLNAAKYGPSGNPIDDVLKVVNGVRNLSGSVLDAMSGCGTRQSNCGWGNGYGAFGRFGNFGFGGFNPCGISINQNITQVINIMGNNNTILNNTEQNVNRNMMGMTNSTYNTYYNENSRLNSIYPQVNTGYNQQYNTNLNNTGVMNVVPWVNPNTGVTELPTQSFIDTVRNPFNNTPTYKPWVDPNIPKQTFGNPPQIQNNPSYYPPNYNPRSDPKNGLKYDIFNSLKQLFM
ncbi:MAG: hypothetical protein H7836_13705 [Magnetococcus sp. YQC-3]